MHAIVEAQVDGQRRGTLRYLLDRFDESMEFKELTIGTQSDYRRYADALAAYVRRDGTNLGDVQVDRITTPVVQRLVEVFAMGRPANRQQPSPPATPSKANHLFRYLRRTLAWGVRNGHCTHNPATRVRQAREAKQHRTPTPDAYHVVLAFA